MKAKKFLSMPAMLLLAGAMTLTSCDDILGEWDRPTPQTPAAAEEEPSVTFYVWDSTANKLVPKTVTGNITTITETTTTWSGVCVVDKDITITGEVIMDDDVELIIADGVKLTIIGKIADAAHSLKLYGQEAKSGQFVVDNSAAAGKAIEVKGLEIAGLKVNVKAQTTAGSAAINTSGKTVIYDGADVTANGNQGIFVNDGGELEILGGTLNLTSVAQNIWGPSLIISGGTITASGDGNGGNGVINCTNVLIKNTISEIKITNTAVSTEEKLSYWLNGSTSLKFGTSDTHVNADGNNIAAGGTLSGGSFDGIKIVRGTGSPANKSLTITPNS